jgi:hypothetical protein
MEIRCTQIWGRSKDRPKKWQTVSYYKNLLRKQVLETRVVLKATIFVEKGASRQKHPSGTPQRQLGLRSGHLGKSFGFSILSSFWSGDSLCGIYLKCFTP